MKTQFGLRDDPVLTPILDLPPRERSRCSCMPEKLLLRALAASWHFNSAIAVA